MAKSDNLFNIRGKVGDLIFFQRNGKTFVKKNTGGFVNGKSHEHVNSKAVQQRFKEIATFVGSFRNIIFPLIWRQKDGTFHNQLVSFFSKIRKNSAKENLYLALLDAYQKNYLQHIALNKNSKLNPFDCSYSAHENKLVIASHLLYNCYKKHPTAYLEIILAWVICTDTLDIQLINQQFYYFSLEEYSMPGEELMIILQSNDLPLNRFNIPIVSIQVVNNPTQSAVGLHPFHYILTTIL